MTQYANRYLVLTAIGWQGKTLPAGASLTAVPGEKTEALMAQGAIRLDAQAHIDNEPIVVTDPQPKPDSAVAFADDPDPAAEATSDRPEVALESLTVAQLTELAASQGIDLLGVKKKADIVELLSTALHTGVEGQSSLEDED